MDPSERESCCGECGTPYSFAAFLSEVPFSMAAKSRMIDSSLVLLLWWLYEMFSEWCLIVEPVVEVAAC